MTTTGKRPVASDAFLPSGAFDSFTPRHSSYHDISNGHRDPNLNGSHSLSPAHPSIFPPQTNDLLPLGFSSSSGHLPPSINRYLSSPTKTPTQQYHHQQQQLHIPQSASSPSRLYPDTLPNGSSALYRSVSADATNAPAHAHAIPNHALVQRLAQQNALIREAWEAERNYLEANRRRAEEVYQEERVIMEEVREAWENEKAALLRENQTLKERIQRLEGENATLRAVASQGVQATGVMSPLASQRDGSTDASVESGPAHHSLSPQQAIAPVADPSSLPPGLDGAARRPHHALAHGGGSRATSPKGQPESSPFIPLDPRMQPQTQHPKDFLKETYESEENTETIPTIDIQEVDPKLEGIALKATAVQRYTFGESNKSSPATSPPTSSDPAHNRRQELPKRHSSKDQTIQVMQAEESRRLTMHAGHTPNHSLSLFPTMSVADSTGAATQEDDTAPVQSAPPEKNEEPQPDAEERGKGKEEETIEEPQPEPVDPVFGPEDPEEQLEPTDDVTLKGPLMIKNIPAQDDIFWDQVNKKLEPISQGQDSLPTVMRPCLTEEDAESSVGPPHVSQHVAVGGDAHHDPRSTLEDQDENVAGKKDVEGDVPLKLRSTTNFGAPFGMA